MTVLLILVTGFSCQARLNVVATTPDLASIAQEVGGAQVEITTLVKPTEDPHFVDPKPSFMMKLNRAEVLIEGGAELESGWLTPLVNGARNPRIAANAPGRIRANQGVEMLEIPTSLDRSQGDLHAAGNPHYMVDPVGAGIVARQLAVRFAQLDPKSAGTYLSNLTGFTNRLEKALASWKARLALFRGSTLVSFHNSWPYFANRFDLRIDLFLEPKPGIPPTPAHLAELIASMKERNARVILLDTYQDRRTAEMVAARTGGVVLEVSHFPGALKGDGNSYIDFMNKLVEDLAKALTR